MNLFKNWGRKPVLYLTQTKDVMFYSILWRHRNGIYESGTWGWVGPGSTIIMPNGWRGEVTWLPEERRRDLVVGGAGLHFENLDTFRRNSAIGCNPIQYLGSATT